MYSEESTPLKRGTLADPTGLWLVDKPCGISSFGVVARLRRATGIKKIGHTGTLDPLASGLMLLLVGKEYTRLAQGLTKADKVYELTCKLGETSQTDDEEGEKTVINQRVPTRDAVDAAIARLNGDIQQTPPAFSAIKVAGQRAYKLARQGKTPDLQPRTVQVYAWQAVHYDYPYITAKVSVSSGTYIRSLARDLGEYLGTGAYLTALRRTRVGEYGVADAVTLDKFEKI